jgi:hypothetical protein
MEDSETKVRDVVATLSFDTYIQLESQTKKRMGVKSHT